MAARIGFKIFLCKVILEKGYLIGIENLTK